MTEQPMTPRMSSSSYSAIVPAFSWANRRASAASAGCSFSARSAWATRPTLLGHWSLDHLFVDAPNRYVSDAGSRAPRASCETTDRGLVELARRVGYESGVLVQPAFKHAFGVAPRAYRDQPDTTSVMVDFVVRRR